MKTEIDPQVAEMLAAARIEPETPKRIQLETEWVRSNIPEEFLKDEPMAQQSAWVGYRYMTPLARTELFTRAYFDANRQMKEEFFPEKDAAKSRPIDPEYSKNMPSAMSALWHARSVADTVGLPYPVYIETVMRGCMASEKWTHIPRPNQLYHALDVARARHALTMPIVTEHLYAKDWDPRFSAENYSGDPVQIKALAHLCDLVEASPEPAGALAEYLCVRKIVPLDVAREAFGDEMVDAALALSPEHPIATADPEQRKYIPACAGFRQDGKNFPCDTCPVRAPCRSFDLRVRVELKAKTGSEDPIATRGRADGARRQQEFRNRQKAKKAKTKAGTKPPTKGGKQRP